jgi:hypothetical protein
MHNAGQDTRSSDTVAQRIVLMVRHYAGPAWLAAALPFDLVVLCIHLRLNILTRSLAGAQLTAVAKIAVISLLQPR